MNEGTIGELAKLGVTVHEDGETLLFQEEQVGYESVPGSWFQLNTTEEDRENCEYCDSMWADWLDVLPEVRVLLLEHGYQLEE